MTTQEKIDLLCKDWLGRDGDTFTKIRRSDRIGWEETLPKGTPYSEAFTSVPTDEELIKRAYDHSKKMLTAMGLSDKVKIAVEPNCPNSMTNGKNIYVQTNFFDDDKISNGEKIDIFTGGVVHESCHVLYTDFESIINEESSKNNIIHTLLNIIEDERIEMICGEQMPGFANFLAVSKKYHMGDFLAKMGDNIERMPKIMRLMNVLISLVRFPSQIDTKAAIEFIDELLEAKAVLKPYPRTTYEALKAAEKMYDILKTAFEKIKQEEKQKQEQEDKNNKDSEDNSDSSDEISTDSKDKSTKSKESNKDNKDSKDDSDDLSSDKSNDESNDDSDDSYDKNSTDNKDKSTKSKESNKDNGDSKDDSDDLSSDKSNDESNDDSDESSNESSSKLPELTNEEKINAEKELQKVLKNLAKKVNELITSETDEKKDLKDDKIAEAIKNEKFKFGGELENVYEGGITTNARVFFPEGNKSAYQQAYENIKKYIPAMTKQLRCNGEDRTRELCGLRSGRLNTRLLASAVQGRETIYSTKTTSKADKMAVCVLIDESGSMDCDDKVNAAREAAILLTESLSAIKNIDLYVYGHTTTCAYSDSYLTLRLDAFVEQGKAKNKYSLGSVEADSENLDGSALLECGARVRRHTQDHCLLFILSDGAPNESYKFVKECVNKLEKQNFSVVSIGIQYSSEPGLMYDNHINLEDMSRFAPELGKIVKKAILQKSKRAIA